MEDNIYPKLNIKIKAIAAYKNNYSKNHHKTSLQTLIPYSNITKCSTKNNLNISILKNILKSKNKA